MSEWKTRRIVFGELVVCLGGERAMQEIAQVDSRSSRTDNGAESPAALFAENNQKLVRALARPRLLRAVADLYRLFKA